MKETVIYNDGFYLTRMLRTLVTILDTDAFEFLFEKKYPVSTNFHRLND